MKIIEIKATERIDECWDLLLEHREELATHKDIMVLEPDRVFYKGLEDENRLLSLALVDNDEKIVGYSVTILTHALHYSSLPIAANDLIFVHKDHRGGRWGLALIKETERLARVRLPGQHVLMTFHGKQNTSFSQIMPRLGYGVQDIIFSKVI